MSIVSYLCDTCNRQVDINENKQGLEIIDRCIATFGCRGSMDLKSVNKNNNFGKIIPRDVENLTNYRKRAILFTHTQSFASKTWEITHNLKSFPSVQIYINVIDSNGNTNLVEIEPTSINNISKNTLVINFNNSYSGIAQCIARTASDIDVVSIIPDRIFTNITPNSELTIATLYNQDIYKLDFIFLSTKGIVLDTITVTFPSTTTINSPWRISKNVLIFGKIYTTRSINIATLFANIPDGSSFYIGQQFIDDSGTPLVDIGVQDLNINDAYILLTYAPFTINDVNLSKIFNLSSILTAEQGTSNVFYKDLTLFAFDDKLTNVFPEINISVTK